MGKVNMICEHKNCKSEIGKDYVRLPAEQAKGWEDEPIFLCDKHAKGHTPEMQTTFVYDNRNNRCEVIAGLKKGDILICTANTFTNSDLGASGIVFRTEGFIDGKTYKVDEISTSTSWRGVGYVIDEDGCSNWATPDIFKHISVE